jgi:4-alpha-glucanotransferase
VAYTGTHDNDTVRGWWAAAPERERRLCRHLLACGDSRHPLGDDPRHLQLARRDLAVFPMQDVLGLDSTHRMNLPGTVGGGNWTWRFDWPMVGDEPGRVLGLITAASGRGVPDRRLAPASY